MASRELLENWVSGVEVTQNKLVCEAESGHGQRGMGMVVKMRQPRSFYFGGTGIQCRFKHPVNGC